MVSEKFFNWLLQTTKLSKVHTHKVMSASGANLGPIGQCDLTFWLGNRYFMDRFIILQDLWRNLILGLHWQCNYRIGRNWNVNGQQYITHNSICTSTVSSKQEPIKQNWGALQFPPRSTSVIAVQTPTELNTKHIYQLNASEDLPSGIIPLAVDHRIDHKYPKLLNIPLLTQNMM